MTERIIQDDATHGRCYTSIHRIEEFPKLILGSQIGHRNEFFRSKLNKGKQECTLTLVLYPGGYDDDHGDHVAIRASVDREIQRKILIDVAICDENNEERFQRRIVLAKGNYERVVVKDFVGKTELLDTISLLHNGDELKVLCRVFFEIGDAKPESAAARLLSKHRHAHVDKYEVLFDNGDFSDFELSAGETIFKVHKCVLASHSRVFAAMFRSDMCEKKGASTVIEDVDAETLRELLRFIYVVKVERLDELASELWIAADKYEVKGLKEVCEEKLIEKLSADTVMETLCFLDKYNGACKLKVAAIQVIIDNVETISDDGEFKNNLKTLSSDLLSEVLVVMCNSLKCAKKNSQ